MDMCSLICFLNEKRLASVVERLALNATATPPAVRL